MLLRQRPPCGPLFVASGTVSTMCGRYLLSSPSDIVSDLFGVDAGELTPRWNIAPTQSVPIVRPDTDGVRVLDHLRWGLIPPWSKDGLKGRPLINARSETAAGKPSFREAMRARRCLVPADGFYEWKRRGIEKQPFCIRRADGCPLAMAGLWERWSSPEGDVVESFCILTTTPTPILAGIHDRMPVILEPGDYDTWLDAEHHDAAAVQPLLRPCGDDILTALEVRDVVNRPANDSPDCCEPVSDAGPPSKK